MAAKRKSTKKPKTPLEAELIPHKIVGELVGKRLNEHGEIIDEQTMGTVAIFAANFGKVPQLIEADLERAREADRVRREVMDDER